MKTVSEESPRRSWHWVGWLVPTALTPRGLAARGLLIALALLAVEALGLRESTSVLSGTSPDGGTIEPGMVIRSGAYVFFWLAFVVLTPILLLAAALLAGLERWLGLGGSSR